LRFLTIVFFFYLSEKLIIYLFILAATTTAKYIKKYECTIDMTYLQVVQEYLRTYLSQLKYAFAELNEQQNSPKWEI